MKRAHIFLFSAFVLCFITGISAYVHAQTPDATTAAAKAPTTPVQKSNASNPLEWSAMNGTYAARMISPSGDILDSGRDGMAALELAVINVPEAGLTPDVLKDPKKAGDIIVKALYLPSSPERMKELTTEQVNTIRVNQKKVLDQITSYMMTYGLKLEKNAQDFNKRRQKAQEFIPTAQNNREDFQVLNGITLGLLSEMNKMLSMTANRSILQAGENLSSTSALRE